MTSPVGSRLREEHHELVAAVAGGGVEPSDTSLDDLGDAAQDVVAVEVAELVVISLSSSRSIISSPKRRPMRDERWISRSTAAKKKARLNRPVSESTVESGLPPVAIGAVRARRRRR